jgi:hypothetical protein
MDETTTVRNRIRCWMNDNPSKVETAKALAKAAAVSAGVVVVIRVTDTLVNNHIINEDTEE